MSDQTLEQEKPLSKKEVIDAFMIELEKTDQTLQQVQKNSNRIYHRTTLVIRTVFATIGLLLVLNMYFIYDFGKDVIIMIKSMEQMYAHFGEVTEEVDAMTGSVVNMSKDMELLPKMAERMNSMNQTVGAMTQNVNSMKGEVGMMSTDVYGINQNMTNMSYRFEQVNGNVSNIGYRVHQMSRSVP